VSGSLTSAPGSAPSKERFVDVDFEVIREPWNKYQLTDGAIVKVKLVLTVVRRKELVRADGTVEKTLGYSFESQSPTVVHSVPENLKGPPSTESYDPKQLESAVVQDDISYSTLFEDWNEYIDETGSKIRLKTTVSRVARTSKFDRYGNPVYLVQSHGIADVKVRKAL